MGNGIRKTYGHYAIYKDEPLFASSKLDIVQEIYGDNIDLDKGLELLREEGLEIKET